MSNSELENLKLINRNRLDTINKLAEKNRRQREQLFKLNSAIVDRNERLAKAEHDLLHLRYAHGIQGAERGVRDHAFVTFSETAATVASAHAAEAEAETDKAVAKLRLAEATARIAELNERLDAVVDDLNERLNTLTECVGTQTIAFNNLRFNLGK